jgi:fructose/tagatose bisphosphate aldolase
MYYFAGGFNIQLQKVMHSNLQAAHHEKKPRIVTVAEGYSALTDRGCDRMSGTKSVTDSCNHVITPVVLRLIRVKKQTWIVFCAQRGSSGLDGRTLGL